MKEAESERKHSTTVTKINGVFVEFVAFVQGRLNQRQWRSCISLDIALQHFTLFAIAIERSRKISV